MRLLIQRVARASVEIGGRVHSSIGRGLLVFVGIENADGEEDIEWLCNKLLHLRIFDDEAGVMNLDVQQAGGDVAVVSQFTLHASTRKGNRRRTYVRRMRRCRVRCTKPLSAASGSCRGGMWLRECSVPTCRCRL